MFSLYSPSAGGLDIEVYWDASTTAAELVSEDYASVSTIWSHFEAPSLAAMKDRDPNGPRTKVCPFALLFVLRTS